jgi:hypothetical protein
MLFLPSRYTEAQTIMYVNGKKVYVLPAIKVGTDTLPLIRLRTVYIIPARKFKNARERKRYSRLVRDIKKVYPLAVEARNRFYYIQSELQKIKDPIKQKLFLKEQEQLLKDEFEDDIRRLTIRQGRLLIKLIDRETDKTSYELIKELKGSFSAFFWQTVARFFGENLKEQYDPEQEDKYIEEIVHRIENGQL